MEKTIENLLSHLDRVLAWILMFLMASMVAGVTWQVISRFILNAPSDFTEELARFQLIWIGILGAAYAYRKHAHLGLDLLTSNLPKPAKLRTAIVSNVLCLGFAAIIMVYGGGQLVALILSLGQLSAALQIKMGYVYSVLPISGFLICIYALENIRLCLNGVDYTETPDDE